MTEPTKWERITPKRLASVLDELRKLARTGAPDYEPIPRDKAANMLSQVDEAVAALRGAYGLLVVHEPAPRERQEPLPVTDEPQAPTLPSNPLGIAFFINPIPSEHLSLWAIHLSTRIFEEFPCPTTSKEPTL